MKSMLRTCLTLAASLAAFAPALRAGINMSPTFTYAEEGGTLNTATDIALVANGGTATAKDLINAGGYAAHQIAHLNDGRYGNDFSWIGNEGTGQPSWAVISFGATLKTVASLTWGRDNTGTYGDRCQGTYTIQYTTIANPDATTPDGSWTTIGTISLTAGGHPGFTSPSIRHRFNINSPVSATGIRIISPVSTCQDEIELYSTAGAVLVPPPPGPLEVVPSSGFTVSWDGTNGAFNSLPVPGPPANIARIAGVTAFANSLIAGGGYAAHQIPHLNDGSYGNANSWIGEGPNSFAGVTLTGLSKVVGIAWGRDNTATNYGDRWPGLYTIQRTLVASPGAGTPATGDPTTGWANIGTVSMNFNGAAGGFNFTGNLRHQFALGLSGGGDLQATGMRLVCAADGTCIDELEIYGEPPPPPPPAVLLAPEPNFILTWDGNDGANYDLPVPNNLALASNGATAIASGELAPTIAPGFPYHRVFNLNDGLYGNANSWIGGEGDAPPWYAGVMLPTPATITSVSWGRDNSSDNFGAGYSDRWTGTYTIQVTSDGSNWVTVGTVSLSNSDINTDTVPGGGFTGRLRHEFAISTTGGPILASGVRVLVSSTGWGGVAIDEFEVYGTLLVTAPVDISSFTTGPGAAFSLTFASSPGASYRVQYSEDLIDWATYSPNLTGAPGATTTFSGTLTQSFLPGLSVDSPPRVYFRVN